MACISGTVSSGCQPAAFADAAGGSVAADDCAGANFFTRAVAAAFDFEDQSAAIGMKRMKAAAEFHAGSGFAGFIGEPLNQGAALDDEIGILQWECGKATVGEKFETADFVDNAVLGGRAEKRTHAMRDDERSLGVLEILDALEARGPLRRVAPVPRR